MFTTTSVLLAAGLLLNVGAIAAVGVAFRRALRRYRVRTADPRTRATATAVVDISAEVTTRIPVSLMEAVDPWEGTPLPPVWGEAYVLLPQEAVRQFPAAEPGQGRRVIPARRNAAPVAAEPPFTSTALLPRTPDATVRVVEEEDGGRWIELVLTRLPAKK